MTLLSLFPKMIEDGLYFSCEVPDDVIDNAEDDVDDAGFSVKSGPQSLSEDYLLVTRRPGVEDGNLDVGNGDSGNVDIREIDDVKDDPDTEDPSVDGNIEGLPPGLTPQTICEGEKVILSSGIEMEQLPATSSAAAVSRSSNLKASLRAPRKRVNGGNGRDRSASPLCLPKDDNHFAAAASSRGIGKEDYLLDAETQSLSSLCVEPPLSVNDNLDDRMDDLSLDEELEEMRGETMEGIEVDDESVAFSMDVPESTEKTPEGFPKANDTGEDALLDEIDQVSCCCPSPA